LLLKKIQLLRMEKSQSYRESKSKSPSLEPYDEFYGLQDKDDKSSDVEKVVIRIRELDVNNLRPRSIDDDGVKYAMIGKPGTGKSSIIKSYMYSKRHIFPVGLFCNGTEDSTQFFSKHVPDLFIHPLSLTLVESFIKRQKLAKQYLSNPWNLFITDDCMDNTKIFT